MKNKSDLNLFFRSFGIVVIVIFAAIAAGIGLFYYVFAIPAREGLSLASWPDVYTDNFSIQLEEEQGELKVKEFGIEDLDRYGLWLQVIDENGQEVFSHNKPENCPNSYTASELLAFGTNVYDNDNRVFAGNYEGAEKTYGYFIGFPYAVGKHMLYYNGEHVSRLSPVIRTGIACVSCAVFLFTLAYVFWLSRHLGKITKGIRDVSRRAYTPCSAGGVFGEVYAALSEMDTELRRSDQLRIDTERVRREWITNITHDVKTPLSPIKGYAELLAENQISESSEVQEYGKIILKNAVYTENLINDLKLTYQFEAGVIPLSLQEIHLVRYIRELVIDLINDPAFSKREIEFESAEDEVAVQIDSRLFRRAVGNLIINALTHNPPETKVFIRIERSGQGRVSILLRDNGTGMDEEEQAELFERYYRGTNTKEKPEGSGLGLAIAKQIVILHGGDITVKSKRNEGTAFRVSIPEEYPVK